MVGKAPSTVGIASACATSVPPCFAIQSPSCKEALAGIIRRSAQLPAEGDTDLHVPQGNQASTKDDPTRWLGHSFVRRSLQLYRPINARHGPAHPKEGLFRRGTIPLRLLPSDNQGQAHWHNQQGQTWCLCSDKFYQPPMSRCLSHNLANIIRLACRRLNLTSAIQDPVKLFSRASNCERQHRTRNSFNRGLQLLTRLASAT